MPDLDTTTEVSDPYLDIQGKLETPFDINELEKDHVSQWLVRNDYEGESLRINYCGAKVISLKCLNGHQKLVRTTCHKEICPRCGKKGSLAHRKRHMRALDRLLWSPILGYVIFTLPRHVSDLLPDKKQLSDIEKKAIKVVQENFSSPGCMVRTHLMGEDSGHLHIHINVLFPITNTGGRGKVPKDVLSDVRQQWTQYINQKFNLKEKVMNIFYKFTTEEMQMRHRIRYVTRPVVTAKKFMTLPDSEKKWYLSLKGWHNTRWYGKLANCKYKEFLKEKGLDPTARLEEDIATARKCPVCRERYRFVESINVEEINDNQFIRLDNNIWVDFEIFAAMKAQPPPSGFQPLWVTKDD